MPNKILITSKVAVFTYENKTYTVLKSNELFDDVVLYLQKNDVASAHDIIVNEVKQPTKKIKIKGNNIYFKDEQLDSAFTEAYVLAKENGLAYEKLELFFENLKSNPSPISVNAFSSFLAKSKMPITDRGTFLAYKKIRGDNYQDIYTNSFDNRPGAVCQMDRNSVDADQKATCSSGFHVCSYEYLGNFGSASYRKNSDVCMVVEINPKDVVAVPPDYDMTKMRVASYRVLCTLDYFKKKLLNYHADALGNIPVFNTEYLKNWKVMDDISIKGQPKTYMTAGNWLKLRDKTE